MPSILSIPPEVVAEVFEWAITSSSEYCNLSSTSLPQDVPPINISQVCRYWRQIALSQPSLWAFINVVVSSDEDLQRALPRVKSWLQRSSPSSAPLTIKVSILTNRGGTTYKAEVVHGLFRELYGHKGRWKNFTISFSDFAATALKLDDLPMLQELEYRGSWSKDATDKTQQQVDLSTIPLLRRFSASGPIELSAIPQNLVLANLTFMHFKIGYRRSLTANDCLNILRCTPNVKEFCVDVGSVYNIEKPKRCIHLADLSYLHISWTWPGDGPVTLRLLDGIEPPSLKTLSVDYSHYPREDDTDDREITIICNFISRCNISLTDLRMSSDHENLNVVGILRLSPDLQKLELHCYGIPDEVYAGLSERLADKKDGRRIGFALCPRLASILLFSERVDMDLEVGYHEVLKDSRPMVEMISRRWNVPTSQRSLSVVKLSWLSPEDVPELKAMVSEGLHWG